MAFVLPRHTEYMWSQRALNKHTHLPCVTRHSGEAPILVPSPNRQKFHPGDGWLQHPLRLHGPEIFGWPMMQVRSFVRGMELQGLWGTSKPTSGNYSARGSMVYADSFPKRSLWLEAQWRNIFQGFSCQSDIPVGLLRQVPATYPPFWLLCTAFCLQGKRIQYPSAGKLNCCCCCYNSCCCWRSWRTSAESYEPQNIPKSPRIVLSYLSSCRTLEIAEQMAFLLVTA